MDWRPLPHCRTRGGGGKGGHGVPVPGSLGLRRWRSGGTSAVKAVAGESSDAGHSGLGNGARRSGGGAVGGGDVGATFYRVGGVAG
jgi:hypothetical protein